MKKLNIIGLLAVLVLLLAGCEETKLDIVRYGSLSGVVVDGDTYQPLEGVLVATNPASSSVLTNSQGEFSFSKIISGEVTVTSKKKDYLSSNIIISVIEDVNTEMTVTMLEDENDYGSVTIYDPVPGNGAVNQYDSFTMEWKVDQSKSDIVLSYDVLLFESNSTTQMVVGESLTIKEVVVDNLKDNTTYYWYVVAKYDSNIVANSPTWSFKTGDTIN